MVPFLRSHLAQPKPSVASALRLRYSRTLRKVAILPIDWTARHVDFTFHCSDYDAIDPPTG